MNMNDKYGVNHVDFWLKKKFLANLLKSAGWLRGKIDIQKHTQELFSDL